MSKPEPTELGTLTTRDRILKIAAELFAGEGFAGVSMRDIAEAVGIKAASLYNHFNDKEDLYTAALEYVFTEETEQLSAAIKSEGTPQERLVATLIAMATTHANDDVSTKLLLREVLNGEGTRQQWLTESLFKAPFRNMVSLLEEIDPSDDSELTAIYLSALTIGHAALAPMFAQLGAASYSDDPERFAQEIASRMRIQTKDTTR